MGHDRFRPRSGRPVVRPTAAARLLLSTAVPVAAGHAGSRGRWRSAAFRAPQRPGTGRRTRPPASVRSGTPRPAGWRAPVLPMPRALVMRGKLPTVVLLAMAVVAAAVPAARAEGPDPKFYVFLCLGQSNMEGFPGIEEQDKAEVERFKVLAAVDFPKLDRKKGNWYPAVPPLCRGSSGLCPADSFGRTMLARLPKDIRVGVVNVSVAGCKIELFDKANH